MTDSLLYRANLVPERNRRAFLHLLGLRQRGAVPAEGLVAFDATKGPLTTHVVPADAEVRAGQRALPHRARHRRAAGDGDRLRQAALGHRARRRDPRGVPVDVRGPRPDGRRRPALRHAAARTCRPGGARYRPIRIAEAVDRSLWVALLAPKPPLVGAVRDLIGGKVLSLGIVPDVVDASRVLPPASVLRSVPESRLVVTDARARPAARCEPRVPTYRELDTGEHGDVLVEPGVLDVSLPPPDELVRLGRPRGDRGRVGDFPPPLETRRARPAGDLAADHPRPPDRRPGRRARGVVLVGRRQRRPASSRWVGSPTSGSRAGPASPTRSPTSASGRCWSTPSGSWSTASSGRASTTCGSLRPRRSSGPASHPTGRVRRRSARRTSSPATPTARCASATGCGARGRRADAEIRASYASSEGRAGVLPVGGIKTVARPAAGRPGDQPGADLGRPGRRDGRGRRGADERARPPPRPPGHPRTTSARSPGGPRASTSAGSRCCRSSTRSWSACESPGVVTVMVIPQFDPAQPEAPRPDQMFLDSVCEYLDARRLVTTELHVVGPEYVDLAVSVGFDPVPGRDVPDVRERIKATVRALLSPLDLAPGDGVHGLAARQGGRPARGAHRGRPRRRGRPRQRRAAEPARRQPGHRVPADDRPGAAAPGRPGRPAGRPADRPRRRAAAGRSCCPCPRSRRSADARRQRLVLPPAALRGRLVHPTGPDGQRCRCSAAHPETDLEWTSSCGLRLRRTVPFDRTASPVRLSPADRRGSDRDPDGVFWHVGEDRASLVAQPRRRRRAVLAAVAEPRDEGVDAFSACTPRRAKPATLGAVAATGDRWLVVGVLDAGSGPLAGPGLLLLDLLAGGEPVVARLVARRPRLPPRRRLPAAGRRVAGAGRRTRPRRADAGVAAGRSRQPVACSTERPAPPGVFEVCDRDPAAPAGRRPHRRGRRSRGCCPWPARCRSPPSTRRRTSSWTPAPAGCCGSRART